MVQPAGCHVIATSGRKQKTSGLLGGLSRQSLHDTQRRCPHLGHCGCSITLGKPQRGQKSSCCVIRSVVVPRLMSERACGVDLGMTGFVSSRRGCCTEVLLTKVHTAACTQRAYTRRTKKLRRVVTRELAGLLDECVPLFCGDSAGLSEKDRDLLGGNRVFAREFDDVTIRSVESSSKFGLRDPVDTGDLLKQFVGGCSFARLNVRQVNRSTANEFGHVAKALSQLVHPLRAKPSTDARCALWVP